MSDPRARRPGLAPAMTGAELVRWYWLKSELIDFARMLGVATTGTKDELTARLRAALDGDAPRPRTSPGNPPAVAAGAQLKGDLSPATVIPTGQRCSQVLRGWFREYVGPAFRFDRHMREFIRSADGTTTLGDAVKHWESTRSEPATEIDAQFEFNRFTRAWHGRHPAGTRPELLTAWRYYRSLPIDERGRA